MTSLLSKHFIDTHFHVFEAGRACAGARYVPAYEAPLAGWMQQALAQGVGAGVLVQTSFLGSDNSVLLAALRAHPQVLRGVAVVDPGAGAAGLQSLHEAGVRGLRLNLSGVSHDIGAWARAGTLWHEMDRLGWHLELHTDRGALPQVLRQLPAGLPLVLDHMARPHAVSALDPTVQAVRQWRGPVHVKLSGAYRLGGLDPAALAALWLQERGPQHLLWGSDWPCTNHEHAAHYPHLLEALFDWVGHGHAQAILSDNPRALYWA